MIIRIKELMWRLAVSFCALIPAVFRRLVCRLVFDVEARHHQPQGLKNLFIIDDALRWQIDVAAISFEKGIHPKHRLTQYHKYFVDRVRVGETVLDVGCGYGELSDDLAAKGAQVTGIDFDIRRIEFAEKRYSRPNLSFLHGDILIADFKGRFDVLVLSNVLEHVSERVKLLRDLERRFCPRCFLVRVPMLDRHWSVSMRAELGLPHFIDPTHCTEYTVESFCAEMEDAGLKVVQLSVCWGEIWSEVACIPADV